MPATESYRDPRSANSLSDDAPALIAVRDGRSWWAHLSFTRINITPTILRQKIEDLMNVRGVGEKSFLRLKALITVNGQRAAQ